jgi:hypothetical protein
MNSAMPLQLFLNDVDTIAWKAIAVCLNSLAEK